MELISVIHKKSRTSIIITLINGKFVKNLKYKKNITLLLYTAMCVPECQNGGVCSQPNVCDCVDTGYTGDICQMCTLLYLAGSAKDGIYMLYFF